jgi:hypothetical protein
MKARSACVEQLWIGEAGGSMQVIWLFCGVRTSSLRSAIVEFSPIGLLVQAARWIRQCLAGEQHGRDRVPDGGRKPLKRE